MSAMKQRSDAGAFDGVIQPGGRPALLIVDMAMAYLDPQSPLSLDGAEAVASAARLAERARACNAPVLFTTVLYQGHGRDGTLFYRKVPGLKTFDDGSPLRAFPPTLQPQPQDAVFVKQYASAFFGTSLATMLHVERIDTLLIAGFSTSGCVRATTVDAIQHGFAPFVVSSACADRRREIHEANLFDLGCKYAEIVDEEVAGQILSRSPGRCA